MKHKNAVDERPPHGLAHHPQRGVREQAHLRPGWRWLTLDEAEHYLADGVGPRTTPLRKVRVVRRAL